MRLPLLFAGGLLLVPVPAAAQRAATLPPLDEAYRDLERLEAFGLLPRGLPAIAPYSLDRAAGMVRDARAGLAARSDIPDGARADLGAILDRLEVRVGPAARQRPSGVVEIEAGGGRSAGVAYPEMGLGKLDAVLNPLWSGRAGRVYPDEEGAATAARVDVPLTSRAALTAAYRGSWGHASGVAPSRPSRGFEALAARLVVGPLAVQAGRDAVWIRRDGDGLLLGRNGPPLDMIRLGTDRPLGVGVLGEADLSLFAADLGPRHRFPHAKLFGAVFEARPAPGLELGLTVLNKQLGRGAPGASTGDRIKDLALVWDWFRDDDYQFSDKLVGLSGRYRHPGWAVSVEGAWTDFVGGLPTLTFVHSAAYRAALSLPRMGSTGRHDLEAEVAVVGPRVYRHTQFHSGAAVDGLLQGSVLGPDARGASLRYRYHVPRGRGRLEARLSSEFREGDVLRRSPDDRDALEVVTHLPDEGRLRLQGSWTVSAPRSRNGGLELGAGVERVSNLGHAAAPRTWNRAFLVRVWWGW